MREATDSPERPRPRAEQPRAVLFDLGRVLVDWDPRRLYAQLIDDPDALSFFLREVCTLDWHFAHDCGVPMAENAAPLIAHYPHYEALIRAWDTRWADMFDGSIPGVPDILADLHAAHMPLYALTNLPAEKKAHILETYPYMALFRDIIVSGEERVAKPDPAIYAIAERRIGLPAGSVFFIDDNPANVVAAKAYGFDAEVFTDAAGLRAALTARGLLTPA